MGFLRAPHLRLDPDELLDVVAELVRDDVGLREVAGRAEAIDELAVERQVDIDLLVLGAVERPGRRLREAAARLRRAREQDELGVVIFGPELLLPRVLDVVKDEGDELDHLVVGARAGGRTLLRGGARGAAAGEEETARQEEEDQEQQRAAADVPARRQPADPPAADPPEAAATAALAAAILDVVALSPRRP